MSFDYNTSEVILEKISSLECALENLSHAFDDLDQMESKRADSVERLMNGIEKDIANLKEKLNRINK